MAQRVYLIPVISAVVESITRAVLAPSDDAVSQQLDECRARTHSQERASAVSRQFSRRLEERAFESSNRAYDYGLYTAMRPYLITGQSASQAASRTDAVYCAADDLTRAKLIESELVDLPAELYTDFPVDSQATDADGGDASAIWNALRTDLLTVRRMRRAALSRSTYTHETPMQVPLGEGIAVISQDETEPHTFAGDELAGAYGQLLGATLGRVLGLSLPTWWMGRNFWIGLLLGGRLSPFAVPPVSSVRRLRKTLRAWARSPALLFPTLEVPGFVENFPVACEAYSSGLYFPPASVAEWLSSFDTTRPDFVRLSRAVSGYDEADARTIVSVIEECLIWCHRHGYGFMEGDELVGSLGYR
jgi:hypothetical protein